MNEPTPLSGPAESYSLTARGIATTRALFLDYLGRLRQYYGDGSVSEENEQGQFTVTIYGHTAFTAELRGNGELAHIKVVAGRDDFHGMYAMRQTAWNLGLAVKHDRSGVRLPNDPDFVPPHLCVQAVKFNAVLDKSPYELAYAESNQEERVMNVYVRERDGAKIFYVNLGLFIFFMDNQDFEASDEFGYPVADSLSEFADKVDVSLIPSDFYKYFGRSRKIINASSFDIDHIDRKVFLLPMVYELGRPDHNLNILAGGGTLADKVRPHETIDESIKRILRDELKIADDYIGATIYRLVEFDRDRDNKLTPRLRLNIYVAPTAISDTTRRTAQRGWHSSDKDTA